MWLSNGNITGCPADVKAELFNHNFAFIASSSKTWLKVTIKIRVTKTRNMKLGMVAHARDSGSLEAKTREPH